MRDQVKIEKDYGPRTSRTAPKSIKEASKDVPVSDRRISKRSRRTSSRNSISLKVSGSTSVYQLKLMLRESLGVCYRC